MLMKLDRMPSTLVQVLDEFAEAAQRWSLEKLYVDLASAKGKGLTPVEKKILRGLLCGYSPSEISTTIYNSRNSSSVRVYLSNFLYKYLEILWNLKTGETVKINHWSRVITLLEKAGYKNQTDYFKPNNNSSDSLNRLKVENNNYCDWGEAIDVSIFYGREEELSTLERWMVADRCRLVMLNGLGGMGKTVLSLRIAQQIQNNFDRAIWRSLNDSPTLEELLINLINFLSPKRETEVCLPDTLAGKISRLIECLRDCRCLLILDGVDTILQPNSHAGDFQPGYENYGELFKRLGESNHQSCLLLTSREKIKQISSMEGVSLPVRCLSLNGLGESDCQEIIKAKGIVCSPNEAKGLIQRYAENPLAIKRAIATINDLFEGDVSEFLNQEIIGFGGVRELIDQHLNRLSEAELQVIHWLAINQDIKLTSSLPTEIIEAMSKAELIEVLESLNRRSLIYKSAGSFKLKDLFREYLNEQLGQQTCQNNFSDLIQQSHFTTYQIVGKLNITDVRNTQKLNE